jgi:hypothetical protein
MQDDDNRQRIPVERAEPPHQALDRALHNAEIRRRQSMPHAPVAPQFSDEADNQRRWLDGYFTSGCLVPAIVLGMVVLALVALSLFLPPVSLWDEIEKQLDDNNSGPVFQPTTFTVDGLQFVDLNYAPNKMTVYGLTLGAQPADLHGRYGVHVEALTPADYLAGNVPAAGWHCPPDLPEGYALASRVYSLTQSGTRPDNLNLVITALPDSANPGELVLHVWHTEHEEWVFMPAAPAENPLALLTTLANPPSCVALFRQSDMTRYAGVALDITDTFAPDVMAANMRLYPGSIHPTITGALDVLLAPGFKTDQGYDVLPLVQNIAVSGVIDVGTVTHILSNPGLRTEHARQIAAFALAQDKYNGAAIDYRAIPVDQGENYTAFLRELARLLHNDDRTLTVIVPAPTQTGDGWQSGAYDWTAIGQIADRVVLNAPLNPRAYAPDGLIDDLLTWVTTHVIRSKVLLGIDALSIADFGDLTFAPVALPEALVYLGDIQLDTGNTVSPGTSITAQLAHPAGLQAEFAAGRTGRFIRYTTPDGQLLRTIWIMDTDALNLRLERAAEHSLGGAFVWHLMSPHIMPGLANSIVAYKLEQPMPTARYAPVEWRVYAVDAGNTMVAEGSGQIDDLFSFQPASDGTFRIVAQFASGDLIDSVELRVSSEPVSGQTASPAPIPTETPVPPEPTSQPTIEPTLPPTDQPTTEPTREPTPEPTSNADVQPLPGFDDTTPVETFMPPPTLTPAGPPAGPPATAPGVVDYPTATPPPDITPLDLSQPVPVVDPALLAGAQTSFATGLEVGAHIGGVTSSIIQVGRMGLTWVKIDVRYQLGQSSAFYVRGIAEAQANGFKVLLNVTGDPFEFMATDRALYLGGYVQFVGELAAVGADGIEVWYGMNGWMTPDEYVQMLGYAYHAIKTANPNTLVITGALRPVANTQNLDEDDGTYFIRLGEANVAQYTDCIGVTYTLGTVPPTSASGDPRGDSPVYYLPTVTDRAARAAQRPDGSLLPLCFTRFGYLAPEGYPALPEDYAWAQSITVSQQAQWLAEAIQLSQQGTQVRMLIIWSLDAAYFGGGSPEEGYAIIRPDGSCPACDAIAPLFEEE